MFIEVPLFSETSPALRNSWFRACYTYDDWHFDLVYVVIRKKIIVSQQKTYISIQISREKRSNFWRICVNSNFTLLYA